jgi:hypothetical protein
LLRHCPCLLSTVTFEDRQGQTLLTVRWLPWNASELERKTFDESHDSMRGGWTGTLDRLAEYLAEKQSPINGEAPGQRAGDLR